MPPILVSSFYFTIYASSLFHAVTHFGFIDCWAFYTVSATYGVFTPEQDKTTHEKYIIVLLMWYSHIIPQDKGKVMFNCDPNQTHSGKAKIM